MHYMCRSAFRPRLAIAVLFASCCAHVGQAEWQQADGPLTTRWAADVSPDRVLPEYPRPTMVRERWQNLNGLWDYAICAREAPQPESYAGQILVPFAVESALSGVMRSVGQDNHLWYRRQFTVPKDWGGQRVLLHFGAVDWETTVWVNGQSVGEHQGGYDPFALDITAAVRDADVQEIVVRVWDPTNAGTQPRGKQVNRPGSIWYTAVTGIWQTVWLEPVPEASIQQLKSVPKLDDNSLEVMVTTSGTKPQDLLRVEARDRQTIVADATAKPGESLRLVLKEPKHWTPDQPHLYDLRVSLLRDGSEIDRVDSYFGMRSIALGQDQGGLLRLLLNGEPLFQYGPLDQGWWPDGLYTAPTDEALRYDIEMTKQLGFNMLRKHVKIEPERFYYWCDKLGILVWQDMPNGDRHIGPNKPGIERSPESAEQYQLELKQMIDARRNHPSIVMWVPFNEGWGQFDTPRIAEWIKKYDPGRLVNSVSGWTDHGVGDVHDVHVYPGPGMPKVEANRAAVLGEFGGLGLPLAGHTWQAEKNWGYRSYETAEALALAYVDLTNQLLPLIARGLAAAVYTQTTDVEIEVNGLMSYDRELVKMDVNLTREANLRLYHPQTITLPVVADARQEANEWQYTTQKPVATWMQADFDDSAWQTGRGGFGSEGTPGAVIGTTWTSSDIWLRRSFDLQRTDFQNLNIALHHDEDAQVYLNGQLIATREGYTSDYESRPLKADALAAFREGRNVLAVHCRQTRGGQFIDVGFTEVLEPEQRALRQPVAEPTTSLRPPAVPLVVCDPYFSVWSFNDRLTDDWPRHWTGRTHGLAGMVRVDGTTYRFLGKPLEEIEAVQNAKQVKREVHPTRTIYHFEVGPVKLRLTFLTPMLPDDLEILSRPVTYVRYDVQAMDDQSHDVAVYFDATAELAVDNPEQQVQWDRLDLPGDYPLVAMRVGTVDQPILEKDGDNRRIDWGHLYLAAPAAKGLSTEIAAHGEARESFSSRGQLSNRDDTRMPRAANDDWPVLAAAFQLGSVQKQPVSRHLILAYDDEYSIEFFGQKLRPYWRRGNVDGQQLLKDSATQYLELTERCAAFDRELVANMAEVGGTGYGQLCALAYRHAIAAHKIVAGPRGQVMVFSKECFSNGCIATVDVAYPAAPIFMLISNELLKGTVRPVLDYAQMDRWKFPFAPHDLGTYPKANGQRYGGKEESEENQMPVEECGNMLIMCAAICQIDGNADFVRPYWPLMRQWAQYLQQKGLDPENQLCTDDFAGHLAHNVNLSLKAIEAMGAYAKMAKMAGHEAESAEYQQIATEYAQQWIKMAHDGDHYRLTFDRPGTWSQKYNLVWDKLLGLNLFPASVAETEIAYYKTQLQLFGLPLDNRSLYTKTDWELWTATMAESREDFEILLEPVYAFINHTPQRVPLTDWYWTHNAQKRGFQARPVIGGLFIKALSESDLWKKWAANGQ